MRSSMLLIRGRFEMSTVGAIVAMDVAPTSEELFATNPYFSPGRCLPSSLYLQI